MRAHAARIFVVVHAANEIAAMKYWANPIGVPIPSPIATFIGMSSSSWEQTGHKKQGTCSPALEAA